MAATQKSKYEKLWHQIQSAYPYKSKCEQQRLTNDKWTSCHRNYEKRFTKSNSFDLVKYNDIMDTLAAKARSHKRRSSICSFFDTMHLKSKSTQKKNMSKNADSPRNDKEPSLSKSPSTAPPTKPPTLPSAAIVPGSNDTISADHIKCTKQIQLINSINNRNGQILNLQELLRINTSPKNVSDSISSIKSLKAANSVDIKLLKTLKAARKRSKRRRQKVARALSVAKEEIPDKLDWFNISDKAGQPRYIDTAEGKEYVSVLDALVDAAEQIPPEHTQ